MGQALRRASGKIRPPPPPPPPPPPLPPPPSSAKKATADTRPPPNNLSASNNVSATSEVESSRFNPENVLEERDPQFDAMLGKMVGRISSKAGGKLEMGEAAVVEKYGRPMPKLRNTTTDSSRYEERPAPSGTLNVAQLHHVILLHQGKADDHNGPMDITQIAEKFRVDVVQIQKILGSVSIPPQDGNKKNMSR